MPASAAVPTKERNMDTETFREYSTRLNLLYAGCFDALRAAFSPIATDAAPTPAEQREQRWESEGGRPE